MIRIPIAFLTTCVCLVLSFSGFVAANDNDDDVAGPAEIFDQRIMPIFRSPNPSSCVQCHLSSVDLKAYILPSHEKTFVSLRDQGLIDLKEPKSSKILKLIRMGDEDRDVGAKMIHAEMRKAEYEAFSSWIEACCADEKMVNLPPVEGLEKAGPEKSDEIIRHGRKDRILDSFIRNIWSQRMRCFPCHTPDEIGPNQKDARKKFDDFYREHGDLMLIFRKTPMETMNHLLDESEDPGENSLPMLNFAEPAKSLLVLKPLAKLPKQTDGKFAPPSYVEPVSHMGGLKMHLDDQSYKSFLAWISDLARVKNDAYATADELPDDNWFATQKILRLKDTPESWPVETPVQLFVFALNDNGTWTEEPVAFTQGTVTPKHIVNGALFLFGPKDRSQVSAWRQSGAKLPPGKYLIKAYADLNGRLLNDPTVMLGEEEFQGQVVVENAKWQPTFPMAEVVSAGALEK